MAIAFFAITLLLIIYINLIRCRSGHRGLKELGNYIYAHRGLHNGQAPENSMLAFRRAVIHGYGAELDVHLLSDGNLAVFHDYDLQRMTGAQGKIEELTVEDLQNYRLNGTEEVIPELSQVLKLFEGKTPLIIELKSADNVPELCQKVCDMLDTYNVKYCIESFDPRCVKWLRKHRPDVIRGQLSENFLRYKDSKSPFVFRLALTLLFTNCVTQPDFVAYQFKDRQNLSFAMCQKVWRAKGVCWTIRTPEDLTIAFQDQLIAIFEGFEP